DGVRFVPWARLGGQQVPDVIASLLAARDGSLWIGMGAGLSHWGNSQLIDLNMPPGRPRAVDSIVEDGNGVVWVIYDSLPGTPTQRGHVCQVIGVDIRCYGNADGVPDTRYVRLATDTQGNVWMAGFSTVVRWNPASHTSTLYSTKELQSKQREGQPGVFG